MYETFNASSLVSLDSIFNRLQKIVSQLTILGEIITPEELNLKFLRSLPTEWGHSSTNDVNTANVHVSTSSTPVSTASTNNSTACLSDATIYAYLATQPNGSQVVHEDLEQIHEDHLDEIDLKWQLALLSMKARKFYQRTGKKIIINGSDTVGYDKKKVECFNCHKLGHFARECRNPRSQENRSRSQDSSRRTVNVEESSSKSMLAIDGTGFDWSYMADEEGSNNFALMAFSDSKGLALVEKQLVFYKKNEGMLCDQIAVLKSDASFNESDINALKKQVSDCDEDGTVVLESLDVQKPKQADQPRKFTPKACFVCGSFNHLIKDCDFHDKRMVQKPVLNNMKKGTGQREVRPVWTNAMRVNHQNFSNSRRNFAPTAVLTKSSLVPFSTARQSFSRTTSPVSAARTHNNVIKKTQKIEDSSSYDSDAKVLICKGSCQTGEDEAKDSEVCKITRAYGSSSFHGDIQAFLRRLDRQIWPFYFYRQTYSLVQERFKDHPLEGHDLDLWGDLRMLFDPNEEDDIWLNQQYWELLRWKLHEYSGVHSLFLDGTSIQINMLVEKKYPLKKAILEKMINLKIEAEEDSNMAIELIKFIKSQIAEQS
ncbi:ribonuclease H-like domain-containing protein [Tanacetum coccineum]